MNDEITLPDQQQVKRKDDLESIEWGTPSKGGAKKLYFDTRTESETMILERINLMNRLARQATSEV